MTASIVDETNTAKIIKANYLLIFIMLLFSPIHLLIGYEVFVPPLLVSIGVGDFDLDGDLDIVTGHNPIDEGSWGGGIYFLENHGDCNFIPRDSISLYGDQNNMSIGLINNDSKPDILAQYYNPETEISYAVIVTSIEKDSINLFQYGKTYNGIAYNNLLDYNGDNYTDIAYSYYYWEDGNPCGSVGLLTNTGSGVFSQPKEYTVPYPNGFAVGDLNNDGYDDAVESGLDLRLLFGCDTGFVIEVLNGSLGHRMDINDMNNDGWNDIIAMEWNGPGQDKDIYIYYNLGSGSFHADSSDVIHIEQGGSRIVVEDLNNDHYADIVFNSSTSYPNSSNDTDSTYVILNWGNGLFNKVEGYYTGKFSNKSVIADMNGDGNNDILTIASGYPYYPNKGMVNLILNDGSGCFNNNGSAIDESSEIISEKFILSACPNPFNSNVCISYCFINEITSNPILEIYSLNGQRIESYILNSGFGDINLDFNNHATGQYIVCIKSENSIKTSFKLSYVK